MAYKHKEWCEVQSVNPHQTNLVLFIERKLSLLREPSLFKAPPKCMENWAGTNFSWKFSSHFGNTVELLGLIPEIFLWLHAAVIRLTITYWAIYWWSMVRKSKTWNMCKIWHVRAVLVPFALHHGCAALPATKSICRRNDHKHTNKTTLTGLVADSDWTYPWQHFGGHTRAPSACWFYGSHIRNLCLW